MESQEIKKNICRVCLDENVVIDWDSTLYGYSDITYKDCFYKYTQLEYLASDPFSPMLCQICLNGLYNIHSFILKALESHKYFEELNQSNHKLHDSMNFKEDIKYTSPEFETVLVEKIEVEPVIQDHTVYDLSDEETIETNEKIKKGFKRCGLEVSRIGERKSKSLNKKPINKVTVDEEYSITLDTKSINRSKNSVDQSPNNRSKKTLRKTKLDRVSNESIGKIPILSGGIIEEKKENMKLLKGGPKIDIKDSVEQLEPRVKKKYKEIKKPRMCSICSKILHNKYAVQMHEKTHMENRERKETCKVCGLKFYDKRNLYSHKRIHKENREKVHKCEFCNKAFYDKGGLNVHRRIHLGQMIPCSLCPKQYFRQIDLDRHMSSHSATTINSDTKKRSRYFVRCKHCDKSILSTSFKSHTAAHLNEPLMKCSICSKEFFRRGSCVLHVKKVHQKTNEEYNDFIILYKKNRISHLFLEQKAEIQLTDE